VGMVADCGSCWRTIGFRFGYCTAARAASFVVARDLRCDFANTADGFIYKEIP
jgi:hypothetical protein